jgi:glycosyltransferase involved in cell wall biosynthesis
MPSTPSWHIITGEYPPRPGGVSDYTEQLAYGLASKGEDVEIWTPSTDLSRQDGRVRVNAIPDFKWTGLRQLSFGLAQIRGPKRLLVQYVPPAFGLRGMNVPFCYWLANRIDDEVWVQFHEVAYGFEWRQPVQHNFLALIQWWMAQVLAGRSQRIFISIPGWRRQLGRHADRAEVLPIPSNLPDDVPENESRAIRTGLGTAPLVGHFGTYGRLVTDILEPEILQILRSIPDARFMLLGRGSLDFAKRFAAKYPDVASRIVTPSVLAATEIAAHIAACDLLLQPYPDGITGRRTTAMAAIALGKSVVTTSGRLTEEEWHRTGAVVLTPVGRMGEPARAVVRLLLATLTERETQGARGRAWYREQYSLRKTMDVLLFSP